MDPWGNISIALHEDNEEPGTEGAIKATWSLSQVTPRAGGNSWQFPKKWGAYFSEYTHGVLLVGKINACFWKQ